MSELDPRIAELLARMRVVVEPEPLVLVRLPAREAGAVQRRADRFGAPFCLTFSPQEVFLVCREVEWERAGRGLQSTEVRTGYRMITLDVALDPDTVGYLAVVTDHLSRVGLPVIVLSTFHRDRLLVPDADLERVIQALEDLLSRARGVADPRGAR